MRRLTLAVLGPPAMVMALVAVAALGAGIAQTGGVTVHASAIAFKPERINPVANVKNLFSLRAAARLGKSLIPAGFLAVFAVQRIARQLTIPPFSTARLELLGQDVYGLLLAAAWLLFGWSAIDYLVEWQSRESRLKMSRQDLRDEYKETEGSPQIRGRIRSLQRQMRRRRVKADVAKAAVVLTNPTHYAVALGFDFVTMEAPKVLAKGRNLLAEEIKAEARWAGVPIIENPPLARSLYRTVEVGQSIPVDLYAAVAAILAYLYRQRVEAELKERRAREAAALARSSGFWRTVCNEALRGFRFWRNVPNEHSSTYRPGALPAQTRSGTGCATTCCRMAAISVIFVMLVPLPAAGLDFLLALSMAASVIVFLSAVQIRRAVELSVFPTLLLLLTLFRLSLNIASSRRILLHGQEGTARGGQGDRGLRAVRGGRQLCGRLRAVSGPGGDSVSGGLARRGAHRRGDGALHAGCACRANRWPSTRT